MSVQMMCKVFIGLIRIELVFMQYFTELSRSNYGFQDKILMHEITRLSFLSVYRMGGNDGLHGFIERLTYSVIMLSTFSSPGGQSITSCKIYIDEIQNITITFIYICYIQLEMYHNMIHNSRFRSH